AFNGNRAPMLLPQPMLRGVLVSRYKRFFADVALDDGRGVTAHCPNPGAMLGMNRPGSVAWVSRSVDPKRKLAHTLELVEVDGGLGGVNTMLPNELVAGVLGRGQERHAEPLRRVGGMGGLRRGAGRAGWGGAGGGGRAGRAGRGAV